MKILGIGDSHDSGVCLVEGGEIVYAANEERFSRLKLDWKFPELALTNLFEYTGVKPSEIDVVAYAGWKGEMTPRFPRRPKGKKIVIHNNAKIKAQNLILKCFGRILDKSPAIYFDRNIMKRLWGRNKEAIQQTIGEFGINAPIQYIEHHICHAATTMVSGFDEYLAITADRSGDGLASSISLVRDGKIVSRLNECSKIHSIGAFWDAITLVCGFNPDRHGGKITGLAAYTPCPEAHEILLRLFSYSEKTLNVVNKSYLYRGPLLRRISEEMEGFDIRQISYGAQKVLEEVMSGIVREAVRRFGIGRLGLSGGVFANVRLNQILLEVEGVEEVFIFPHMGDGGLAVGAAIQVNSLCDGPRMKSISGACYGPDFPIEELKQACEEKNVGYEKLDNYAETIAGFLAQKKVVGIVHGRMEYGPRALCHRTILAEPTDTTMMDWLNERLARTEFMPFAPVILEEKAHEYFVDYERGKLAAKFMTICFSVTDKCRQIAPGIVHKDGTARPQTVSRTENPYIHAILVEYEKKTGRPVCINTSFNRHEEPIVCKPGDAIQELINGSVDHLVIEDYLISLKS